MSVAAEELANARADAAAARRETMLLAAEVDRLRTALVQAEASRQLEITQLLQNAAHHESMVRLHPLCKRDMHSVFCTTNFMSCC